MNPQYEILVKCLLPTHMFEWFDLTNVEVKPKEKTATRDTHSEEAFVNVVHLYLDENALTPDNRVGRLTSPKACARLSVPAFPRP